VITLVPSLFYRVFAGFRLLFLSSAHWWHFMGGMWGVKRKGLEKIPFNFTEELKNFTRKDNNGGTDQIFLQVRVFWQELKCENHDVSIRMSYGHTSAITPWRTTPTTATRRLILV